METAHLMFFNFAHRLKRRRVPMRTADRFWGKAVINFDAIRSEYTVDSAQRPAICSRSRRNADRGSRLDRSLPRLASRWKWLLTKREMNEWMKVVFWGNPPKLQACCFWRGIWEILYPVFSGQAPHFSSRTEIKALELWRPNWSDFGASRETVKRGKWHVSTPPPLACP